jgi:hypothetical protein
LGDLFVKIGHLAAGLCLFAALGGCTVTHSEKGVNASFNFTSKVQRVVIVDPDVSLGELTAGGLVEARADWTAAAKGFIVADITSTLAAKNIEVVKADKPTSDHENQIIKLHDVVGQEASLHTIIPLPNKDGAFDWTLGPGTNELRDQYGADYAIFVYVRDSYTTAGRAAMMIGAAMVGISIQGGVQTAFVSLVDLHTGNIVWFNRLGSSNGDLRDDASAKQTVNNLLDGLPL